MGNKNESGQCDHSLYKVRGIFAGIAWVDIGTGCTHSLFGRI